MGCFFFLFISNFSATNMLYLCSFYKRGKSLKQKKIGGTHNTCGEDVFMMLICLSLHSGGEEK